MKKLKHSKYKNTGILFEMLVRKLTSETMTSDKSVTIDIIKKYFGKKIFGKKVLLIGVSYREDTNDTRYSPAEGVFKFFKKMNCKTSFYDPIVNYWNFIDSYSIEKNFLSNFDVYVYLIKHQAFKKLNISYKKNSLILDLNHVLENKKKSKIYNNKNYDSYFIGSKQQ